MGLLVLSVAFMFGWIMICTWAFLNTMQSHAYTLTGMHGVFTTLFFMITLRREVSFLEKLGTFIVCVGAALMISDPEAKRVGHAARTLASLSSLLANIPGALFWATSKVLEQKMSIINLVFA